MPLEIALFLNIFLCLIWTPFWLVYWLLGHRPMVRRTSQGHVSRPSMGFRIGGQGYSAASVRWSGIFMLVVMAVAYGAAHALDYLWWFGLGGYNTCLLALVFWMDVPLIKPKFRIAMIVMGCGTVIFGLTLFLAWLDYLDCMTLPIRLFYVLGVLSRLAQLYVAIRPTTAAGADEQVQDPHAGTPGSGGEQYGKQAL